MSNSSRCTIRESVISTLKTVTLENELLRVRILISKGADIFEFIYKPLDMDILLKTSNGLDRFEHRNLAEHRLNNYSELFTGGWQDCLPHRARYLDLDITQDTGGIAATVPWAYEVEQNTAECASIRCFVQLPDIPLFIEKTFKIKQGDSRLYVEQRIRNKGAAAVQFTWTQHAAFGGQFLDERVYIEFPACIAFHARQYDRAFAKDLSRFEEPINRVTLPDGTIRNLQEVLPRFANEQIFTVLTHIQEPWVKLINQDKKVGVQLRWELDAFPFIRYWSNNVEDMYTIGIEPSNDAFANFDHSLEHGTYRELQPDQSYATEYTCEIFET
ncbi:DUF4432 family protein [Paenibacillus sp. FSL H8-0034]|uniref:DUF4432 family protein n=1 Tax=Paenibacillus sp. FSL H8-0034 TaxID=2954671 RepID=UPI0030FA8F05